jgi:hypothetical protein
MSHAESSEQLDFEQFYCDKYIVCYRISSALNRSKFKWETGVNEMQSPIAQYLADNTFILYVNRMNNSHSAFSSIWLRDNNILKENSTLIEMTNTLYQQGINHTRNTLREFIQNRR